jgi:hypothetical protein
MRPRQETPILSSSILKAPYESQSHGRAEEAETIVGRKCPGALMNFFSSSMPPRARMLFLSKLHEAVGVTNCRHQIGRDRQGGILGITEELKIPIRYIGVGRGLMI